MIAPRKKQFLDQDLVPVQYLKKETDPGAWESTGAAPQFFIEIKLPPGVIELELEIETGSNEPIVSDLYYDTGNSFNSDERLSITSPSVTGVPLYFSSQKAIQRLRLDPIHETGAFKIQKFNIRRFSNAGFALWRGTGRATNFIRTYGVTGAARKLYNRVSSRGFFTTFLDWGRGNSLNGMQDPNLVLNADYKAWRKWHAPDVAKLEAFQRNLPNFEKTPKFSILLPVYNTPEQYLRAAIESVKQQVYPHWELCIADDCSPSPHVKQILSEYVASDPRIRVGYRTTNGNISAASNSALELATGEFIALLDHDDELAPHALYRVAESLQKHPDADMFYSDEDKLTPDGQHVDPFFKPAWSPEYFLACMYTCHLGVYRRGLIQELGGFRSQFDYAQDYDLVLRVVSRTNRIVHIPDILYHWRMIPTSTASGPSAKPTAALTAQRALEEHLARNHLEGRVENGPTEGFHRVRYKIQGSPLVSIVIPTASKKAKIRGKEVWLLDACLKSIHQKTTYKNYEIVVLDNGDMPSELRDSIQGFSPRIYSFTEPFNLARKINQAASHAKGEQLLLLNDDIEVISPEWIESLLEFSQLEGVGAVGAKLLFPNETIQHAGVAILEGRPVHPFYRIHSSHAGYFNGNICHRNVGAVTGAVMMTKRSLYEKLSGFSEKFPLNYNDVDYCLRLTQAGQRIVYTPYARLYHHESVSKSGTFVSELNQFISVWGSSDQLDPYYNANFSRENFSYKIEPTCRPTRPFDPIKSRPQEVFQEVSVTY